MQAMNLFQILPPFHLHLEWYQLFKVKIKLAFCSSVGQKLLKKDKSNYLLKKSLREVSYLLFRLN